MKFSQAVALFGALTSVVGAVNPFDLRPVLIQEADYGIRWMHERAADHFQLIYDLRDHPNIEPAWHRFLQTKGVRIVNRYYEAKRGAEGWSQHDRQAILDRVSGKTKSDLQFPSDRFVAREAAMELIERFAEEQKAAAAAAAVAESSRAAARRGA